MTYQKNPGVNRCLENKHFDRIDHALGRPVDPLGETYRDHFACGSISDNARLMRASSHWDEARPMSAHWCDVLWRVSRHWADCLIKGIPEPALWEGTAFFYVTKAGREALAAHLREIGEPNRLFRVWYRGGVSRVVAKTRSEAKYNLYLKVSDTDSDLTFADFCRGVRWVRIGTVERASA